MTNLIILLLLLASRLVEPALFSSGDPASYKAARLIVDAIVESETGTGSYFGSTLGTEDDLYVKLKGGQVKTYEPKLFRRMRNNAGVSEAAWLAAMNPDGLENLSADSKSGQAFWRSKDGVIILKSIKHYECRNLRSVLDNLADHLDVPFDHSCISGVLGAFRVKLNNGKKVYLMASKNVYPAVQWYKSKKYDLKGSTVGRFKSPRSSVYKDLDLIQSNQRLQLGEMKSVVLRVLERDAHFLSKCGFMDYSLLVDVEQVPTGFLRKLTAKILNPTTGAFRIKGKMVVVGADGAVYHFGIIDYLQKYTLRKWLETLLKGLFYDRRKISCVEPRIYAQRFVRFIDAVAD